MIIKANVVLRCPKTGKEVRIDHECTNTDGKGNPCPFFKHFNITGGFRLTITCKYEEAEG